MNNTLLDSDVIIQYLRLGFRGISDEMFLSAYISRITYIELIYGYYKSKKDVEMKKVMDFIDEYSISIIEIDKNVSHKFCELKAGLEKKGKAIPDFDLLIASTAIVNNLKLYTKNTRHFLRISGLELL